MSSPDVVWQPGEFSREQRWRALATSGATVWLTGLPASGKSTIGAALEARILRAGRFAYLMDGDNLRHGICGDLGFSAEDRLRNIIRAGELAKLFADAGGISVVTLVSPFADARARVRQLHEESGLSFLEVFVDTPVEVCAARDPKALYARAKAGEITGFTGVDDPYEAPTDPDVVVGPGLSIPDAVEAIISLLDGFAPAGDPAHTAGPGHPSRGETTASLAGQPQNGSQR